MATKTQIATKNNSFTLAKNTFVIPGYVFKGWSRTSGSNNVEYADGATVTLTENTNLYAVWQPAQNVTITFNGNGSSYSGSKTVMEGEPIGSLPVPSWENHLFGGWWTDATDGSLVTENTTVVGSRTYYAHWLTFNPGSDIGSDSRSVGLPFLKYDQNRTIIGAVYLEGYTTMTNLGNTSLGQYIEVNTGTSIRDDFKYIAPYGATIVQSSITDEYALGVDGAYRTDVSDGANVATASPNINHLRPPLFYGFRDQTNLETVNLPNAKFLVNCAFYNCTSLSSITIPKVEIIGTNVFYNCQSLMTITFPSTLTSIATNAFLGSGTVKRTITFTGKTMADIQNIGNYSATHPWSLPSGTKLKGTDGTITVS